jgi:hypothetical protein
LSLFPASKAVDASKKMGFLHADMYCNNWTDDEADSSWWIPVALRVAVSGISLMLLVTCHVTLFQLQKLFRHYSRWV